MLDGNVRARPRSRRGRVRRTPWRSRSPLCSRATGRRPHRPAACHPATERDNTLATVLRSPQRRKEVPMRTTTTALLAVGAATLAVPASASADVQSDFQVPLAGHLTVEQHMQFERTALAQERLTRKAWRLARKLAHERQEGFSPVKYRRRVSDDPPAQIARRIRSLRVNIKREERRDARRAKAERERPSRLGLPHAGGDRRVRVRREPGHEHRQRLLRQVPVHAQHVAERRRVGQPGERFGGRAEQARGAAVRP